MNNLLEKAQIRAKYVDPMTKNIIGQLIAEVTALQSELAQYRKNAHTYTEQAKEVAVAKDENKELKLKTRKSSVQNQRYRQLIKELIEFLQAAGQDAVAKHAKKRMQDVE